MFKFYKKKFQPSPEPKYIGEVYCGIYFCGNYGLYSLDTYPEASNREWRKFTEYNRNINKDHDNYINIFNVCFLRKDVFFYDTVNYGKTRENIENKYR